VSSRAENPSHTCPSGPCEPGAILLGLVGEDDRVGYLTPPVRIDEEFVVRANRGRSPQKRFRFATPCVEAECAQWTGSRCGVIDRVLDADLEAVEPEGLPRCAIRGSCRWFAQAGDEACAVCPLVITDCR
jgi:hypothetical protein